MSVTGATPVVLIGGQSAPILSATPSQLIIQIPIGLPVGPALLSVNNGVATSPSVGVVIDPQPPLILSVAGPGGSVLDGNHPVRLGDILTISLGNLQGASGTLQPARFQVTLGGVQQPVGQVVPTQNGSVFQISVVVTSPPAPSTVGQPLIVYFDGRSSFPATVSSAP